MKIYKLARQAIDFKLEDLKSWGELHWEVFKLLGFDLDDIDDFEQITSLSKFIADYIDELDPDELPSPKFVAAGYLKSIDKSDI
jgi:hypothetical protein